MSNGGRSISGALSVPMPHGKNSEETMHLVPTGRGEAIGREVRSDNGHRLRVVYCKGCGRIDFVPWRSSADDGTIEYRLCRACSRICS